MMMQLKPGLIYSRNDKAPREDIGQVHAYNADFINELFQMNWDKELLCKGLAIQSISALYTECLPHE